MSAVVLPFPINPARAVILIDRRLADIEDAITMARGWADNAAGADLARYEAAIAEMADEHAGLMAKRLRVIGAELAVLQGGRDG